MMLKWYSKDIEKNFYFYIPRLNENDALYLLNECTLKSTSLENLKNQLLNNLKLTLEAATTPLHVGIFSAIASQQI